MDWNNNNNNNVTTDLTPNFTVVSPPLESSSSTALLYNNYNYNYNNNNYNYNLDHHYFPTETTKKAATAAVEQAQEGVVGGVVDQKKKRLSKEQLQSLERSFQEGVKLDPDRKMTLSKELSLQPRQIAVWFQNRRARWKAKQLEHLYDTLQKQFDTISREKHNLQQEVMKLRSMLIELQAARNRGSMAYTDVSAAASGEENVESTSEGVRSCNNYMYNNNHVEVFNQISDSAPPSSFWWGAEAADHLPFYP